MRRIWLVLVTLLAILPAATALNVSIFTPVNNTITNSSTFDVTANFSASANILRWEANTTNTSNGLQFVLCANLTTSARSQANCLANFTSLPDGTYNITGTAQSGEGSTFDRNTTYNITVDRTSPVISLVSPLDASATDGGDLSFNFTATDNLDTLPQCDFFFNGTNRSTFNATNGTMYTYNTSVTGVGTYSWYVSCTDNANNANVSATFSFKVQVKTVGGGGGRTAQRHIVVAPLPSPYLPTPRPPQPAVAQRFLTAQPTQRTFLTAMPHNPHAPSQTQPQPVQASPSTAREQFLAGTVTPPSRPTASQQQVSTELPAGDLIQNIPVALLTSPNERNSAALEAYLMPIGEFIKEHIRRIDAVYPGFQQLSYFLLPIIFLGIIGLLLIGLLFILLHRKQEEKKEKK